MKSFFKHYWPIILLCVLAFLLSYSYSYYEDYISSTYAFLKIGIYSSIPAWWAAAAAFIASILTTISIGLCMAAGRSDLEMEILLLRGENEGLSDRIHDINEDRSRILEKCGSLEEENTRLINELDDMIKDTTDYIKNQVAEEVQL